MFLRTKRLFGYSLKFANFLNIKVVYQDWLFFRDGQFSRPLSVYAYINFWILTTGNIEKSNWEEWLRVYVNWK